MNPRKEPLEFDRQVYPYTAQPNDLDKALARSRRKEALEDTIRDTLDAFGFAPSEERAEKVKRRASVEGKRPVENYFSPGYNATTGRTKTWAELAGLSADWRQRLVDNGAVANYAEALALYIPGITEEEPEETPPPRFRRRREATAAAADVIDFFGGDE